MGSSQQYPCRLHRREQLQAQPGKQRIETTQSSVYDIICFTSQYMPYSATAAYLVQQRLLQVQQHRQLRGTAGDQAGQSVAQPPRRLHGIQIVKVLRQRYQI